MKYTMETVMSLRQTIMLSQQNILELSMQIGSILVKYISLMETTKSISPTDASFLVLRVRGALNSKKILFNLNKHLTFSPLSIYFCPLPQRSGLFYKSFVKPFSSTRIPLMGILSRVRRKRNTVFLSLRIR